MTQIYRICIADATGRIVASARNDGVEVKWESSNSRFAFDALEHAFAALINQEREKPQEEQGA